MEEINYINEGAWIGQLGRFLTVLSFAMAALSTFSFFKSKDDRDDWDFIGKWSLKIHSFSVYGMVIILFSMLTSHLFQYHYVFSHSATDLPFYFQFSSFWEGQEGSFLLWLFWQATIGLVLEYTCKQNRRVVLASYSLILTFLSSMLLGVYIGDYKLGSSPFLLFREVQSNMPMFMSPDYAVKLVNGNGLNPLLQNYWMVIHPPTLFFGYALMAVPFVYSIAVLFNKEDKQWIRSSMNWSLLGGGVLGIGVLMGGAWAYEALSFGGFWAWDPVENASILPWILLVAGLHTLLAYKHKGYSKKITLIFLIGAWLSVIYSSFLTRSGILGDSSVHSFTGNGMIYQLVVFLSAFMLLSLYSLGKNWKSIQNPKEEEKSSSREFWLFLGSLVLLLSWLHIIFNTSIPVYNELLRPIEFLINDVFGGSVDITHNAPPVDVVEFYNAWQLPFGILLAIFTGLGFYFKYKSTDMKKMLMKLIPTILSSIFLGIFVGFIYELDWKLNLFLICSIFSVLANVLYFFEYSRKNIKKAGGVITHFGFAILLVGIILSSGAKEVISLNTIGVNYGEGYDDDENRENILMYKGAPVTMGNYTATYVGDSVSGVDRFFKIYYEQTDSLGAIINTFYLYPNVQDNPKFGPSANPDTKHYLSHDIFTHVTSVSNNTDEIKVEGDFVTKPVFLGDTIYLSKVALFIDSLNVKPQHEYLESSDFALGLQMRVANFETSMNAEPIFFVRKVQGDTMKSYNIVHDLKEMGVSLRFDKIDPSNGEITLSYNEFTPMKEFIIMKAVKFPWINIVWAGCIMLFIGFMISLYYRKVVLK